MKITPTSVELKVKSIWMGLVGIPDKYFIEAVNKGKDLIISVKGETMHIPKDKVVEAAYSRSKEKFKDRFSDAEYSLVYFRWKPTLAQVPLL